MQSVPGGSGSYDSEQASLTPSTRSRNGSKVEFGEPFTSERLNDYGRESALPRAKAYTCSPSYR